MSVEAFAIALNHSRAVGTTKVVMLGIANHDGDGGAWPSIATLAKYANVSERSVQRAISELVTLGEVVRHEQKGGTGRTPEHLRPNLFEFTLACPPDCDRTAQHRTDADRARDAAATRRAEPAAKRLPSVAEAVKTIADWQEQAAQGDLDDGTWMPPARADRCSKPEHQAADVVTEPCWACKRARESQEAALKHETRQVAEASRRELLERIDAQKRAIAHCHNCDADGRLPSGRVCDHVPDPAAADAAYEAGANMAREALAAARGKSLVGAGA